MQLVLESHSHFLFLFSFFLSSFHLYIFQLSKSPAKPCSLLHQPFLPLLTQHIRGGQLLWAQDPLPPAHVALSSLFPEHSQFQGGEVRQGIDWNSGSSNLHVHADPCLAASGRM